MNSLVPFGDDLLEAFWDEDSQEGRVGCRRMAENMGLDWKSQHRTLREDEAFATHLTMVQIRTVTGDKETLTMPLRLVPLYLATIVPGRAKPHLRSKILHYKEKAAEVLAQHFFGIVPRQQSSREDAESYDFTKEQMEALGRGAALVMREYVPPMIEEKIMPIKQEQEAIRLVLAEKISREEAENLIKESLQEQLHYHHKTQDITPGKMTLLMYLEQLCLSAYGPKDWQAWVLYYDIASLEETPELTYKPERRFPLRWYSRVTHEKSWHTFNYQRRDGLAIAKKEKAS